jgi:hypothetical protein
MINQEKFDALSKYPTSSWAIWTEEFNKKGCLEGDSGQPKKYFIENMSLLKNNIILLGLNPSGDPKKIKADQEYWSMRNFHKVGHKGDNCLKETIKNKNLNNIYGAYMTDLSDEINTFAKQVIIKKEHIDIFLSKLEILDTNNFHIVSFYKDKVFDPIYKYFFSMDKEIKIKNNECGNVKIKKHNVIKNVAVTVNEFSVNFNDKKLIIYDLFHYSYFVNGPGNYRRPEFERQMEFINTRVV